MEKTFIDGKEKAARYPMILYNLCNWLGNLERYEESEQVAETGVNFCIQYGNLVAFPRLLFNKGCALASLGKREEAVKIFQQSAAIFLATRQERMARMTVELCKEHYDIDVKLYL
jgi:tetratricopeptide (TPR) repeat protein